MLYIRTRLWAKRAASSPPTPLRTSTMTLRPLRHRLRFFADLLLYHLFEVRLEGLVPGEQGFCLCQVVPLGPQGPVGRHGRLGLVIFLHQAAESGRIGGRFGLVQPVGQLFKPAADRLHLLIQRQRQGALLSASGVRRARKGR